MEVPWPDINARTARNAIGNEPVNGFDAVIYQQTVVGQTLPSTCGSSGKRPRHGISAALRGRLSTVTNGPAGLMAFDTGVDQGIPGTVGDGRTRRRATALGAVIAKGQ